MERKTKTIQTMANKHKNKMVKMINKKIITILFGLILLATATQATTTQEIDQATQSYIKENNIKIHQGANWFFNKNEPFIAKAWKNTIFFKEKKTNGTLIHEVVHLITDKNKEILETIDQELYAFRTSQEQEDLNKTLEKYYKNLKIYGKNNREALNDETLARITEYWRMNPEKEKYFGEIIKTIKKVLGMNNAS